MKPQFIHRTAMVEIMDDLQCSGEVVNQTLRELETINQWLGGNAVTLSGLNQLLGKKKYSSAITIADIGCGGGDMLKEIASWGTSNNLSLTLIGIDANPNIIEFAKVNTKHINEINYFTQNILSADFKTQKFDIVVSSLFMHHFSNEELITMLHQLKSQCNIGIVINDIHRHWLAYHSIRILTRWFSKSAMVQFDAPASVLRAFRRKELVSILNKAGIKNYTLQWKWAFRWQLVIPTSLA